MSDTDSQCVQFELTLEGFGTPRLVTDSGIEFGVPFLCSQVAGVTKAMFFSHDYP